MALKIKTRSSINKGLDEAQKEVLKQEQHRMNFMVNKDIFNKFKLKAMSNYTTPSALIRQWIDDYLEDQGD